MEPQIESEDVQGHVFPGFGTPHSVVIGFKVQDFAGARAALAGLIPEVTTMSESLREKEHRRESLIAGEPIPPQNSPSLALSFGATALNAWGHDTSHFDTSFHDGMRRDAASLGDPIGEDGVPVDWTFGTSDENEVDLLLVAGHSDREALEHAISRWMQTLGPHVSMVLKEYGHRRQGDQEFFGFNDGVSQPAIRGVTATGSFISRRVIVPADPRSLLFAKPGQLLIWPGSFIFGYEQQSSVPTQAGSTMPPPVPWMRNGSYLVLRRLIQNVRAFQEAVKRLEEFLTQKGEVVPEGWVASRLVGRWTDGTPLSVSPTGSNAEISGDEYRINNFQFNTILSPTSLVDRANPAPTVPADPLGIACPRASHIRKINPRDGISEIGQENHPGKLMLRRGIAFGPEENAGSDDERGLLFLSYQTSIVNQFKFVQVNWANSTTSPTGDGVDPIIGQDGTLNTVRNINLFAPSRRQLRCPINGRWVIPTGGGYFVTPGISGLKILLDVK